MAILLKDAFMKYIGNLSETYAHHMLPLLLLNLFPSQSHVNPQLLSPKKPNDMCRDGHTDRHTLTSRSLFRSSGLQLVLHYRSRRFLNCNLSTTISIFNPASWTLLSPFSVQDSRNISNDRHHHKLSSLNNNKKGIIYLSVSKCVTDVHITNSHNK